jgi:P-type Mg2+ transporter
MKKEGYSWVSKSADQNSNPKENGLSQEEAEIRLKKTGLNLLPEKDKRNIFSIFLSQFTSPLILVLFFASLLAFFLKEFTDGGIIIAIILVNSLLSFYQEYKSEKALNSLKKYITFDVKVLRSGKKIDVDSRQIVPGDIVYLNIGDIVPADIKIINSKDLCANESLLTGESNPVFKDYLSAGDRRKNLLFMGSAIISGSGYGIVTATGINTEFGKTATILSLKEPPSDFQKGIDNFGNFLIRIILALTVLVFGINAFLGKGIISSFLFAIALAVGITPELLPVIITISMSKGAIRMAKKKVIVKKLASIEGLGNIDVLCVDKTGTLTENKITLEKYFDIDWKKDPEILQFAALCNDAIDEGDRIIGNPIDAAILAYAQNKDISLGEFKVIESLEFDYQRRRMSIIIEGDKKRKIISKGSPLSILSICSKIKIRGRIYSVNSFEKKIRKEFEQLSRRGLRVIALCSREIGIKKDYCLDDESNMVFLGFLTFLDPPKISAKESLRDLEKLGIHVKVLTGDNEIITEEVCRKVGIMSLNIITGPQMEKLNESELAIVVQKNNIFARVTPQQKYQIVDLLTKKGHIVGFLGDGVNDAPAIKAADIGISVDTAVDVAKESADVILLRKNLEVIVEGVIEGRKTFGNTTKYILNTISANFGNMFTLSISSLFLKFIPLLPSQILLANFISDVPLTTISTDNVDNTYLRKPKRWNIRFISKFMIFFGFISSIFDILTMLLILFIVAPNNPKMFQTIWFVESVLSEIIITFSIRTKKYFWRSKPSALLIFSSVIGVLLTLLAIFWNPIAGILAFSELSLSVLALLGLILFSYLILTEVGKKVFYKYISKDEE